MYPKLVFAREIELERERKRKSYEGPMPRCNLQTHPALGDTTTKLESDMDFGTVAPQKSIEPRGSKTPQIAWRPGPFF